MTTRTVSFQLFKSDGVTAARGSVMATPTRRHVLGTTTILPTARQISVNGVTTADLEVTAADWCWKFEERVNGGTTRYCSITAGATVNYNDLPDVDPKTLLPSPGNLAGWDASLAAAQAARDAAAASA